MTVYLVACCYFRLKLFYFQFFISELWLIDRVESEAGHFTTFVVGVLTYFYVIERIRSTPFSVPLSPYCSPVSCVICGQMQPRTGTSISGIMNIFKKWINNKVENNNLRFVVYFLKVFFM